MNQQFIVAIGLSAGGLDSLKEIIKNLKPNLNATYIIAEHHSPNSEDQLKDILEPLTDIPIKYAKENEIISQNTIYICPANKHIIISENKIELFSIEKHKYKPSINWLFESISKYQSKAIAIVLSGALDDGSNGILNIKLHNGIVIVQDPKTAQFPMMPKNCIDTNLVDFILSPKEIALTLNKLLSFKIAIKNDKYKLLDKIFLILEEEFNVDFKNYKLTTITRRIERRMIANNILSLEEYVDFLEKHHKEKKALFDDLVIIVTSFCRNRDAFKRLKHYLTEYILNNSSDEIKIWNIGCATGEESYSLAIIIQSILDKYNIKKQFHIFSTDISQKAISIARAGKYPLNEINSILPECHLKYFERQDNHYLISSKIRKNISFAIHNILYDTPLTNMDLVVCRNLLIYFNQQAQEKVFSFINYALKDNGLLFIGKSETIPKKIENLFTPLDSKMKIYKKIHNIPLFPINYHISTAKPQKKPISTSVLEVIKENLNKFFNTFIIIDNYGNILYTAGEYDKYLKIPQGEFNNNIFSFIDEELNLPLHTIITQTKNKISSINYKIRLKNNKIQYINLIAIPLHEFKENTIAIFFIPSSSELDIKHDDKNCAELEYELIETKQKLKNTLEELSTANEELQSSNEELQSSNEELITTNEELKAVNESLNKTNNELNKYKAKLEQKVKEKSNELVTQQKIRSAIFENTNNLIAIIKDNKIIDANDSFLKFFETNIENFNFLFKYKKQNLSLFELIHLNKTPIKLKIKDKIFLIKISNLEKNIFAINFIDITIEQNYIKELRKELNKKIKELRKKDILLQNEYKLARMGEMLANISHQYRQPLNLLSLNLSNLEMNIDNISKDDILNCIKKSYKTIQFLSETIDDFKNLFTPNKHKIIVNLRELVENVLNFIEIDKVGKNIDIKIDIDKDLTIASYPNDISHILLNLIHNAKDAILETKPKNPYIKISAKQKDDDIIIKIKDNGGGVKNIKHLFSPYISTKTNGTGIGLYMSKIIAQEKLNGKLWVKNRKKGATFYLRVKNERNL